MSARGVLSNWRQFVLIVAAAVILAGLVPARASAHPISTSILSLYIRESVVEAKVQIPLSQLNLAMQDNNEWQQYALKQDSKLLPQHRAYVLEHIRPKALNGKPWTVRIDSLRTGTIRQPNNERYVELVSNLTITPPAGESTRAFALHYDAVIHKVRTHSVLVAVHEDWASGIKADEPAKAGVIRADSVTGRVQPLVIDQSNGSNWRGFMSMLKYGMQHIREGTDHLLFLLTLLIAAPLLALHRRWQGPAGTRQALRKILHITLAFTAGHSLTLIIGAMMRINIAPQPIEALIAVSILVSAAHAIRPLFPRREIWVAGGFGLIHGMAFSFSLSGLELSNTQMALSLLGFNLGIELMQLIIVAVTMPSLIILARTHVYRPFRLIASSVAMLAAAGWLAERLGRENALATLATSLSVYAHLVIVGLAVLAIASLLRTRIMAAASRAVPGG